MTLGVSAASQTFPVYLVDDHDEVYPHWKSLALSGATLLHLDEHSDFQWIAGNPADILASLNFSDLHSAVKKTRRWNIHHHIHRKMHLGNYLHRVFEEGIVSKWLWGVPDPLWQNPKLRQGLRKILRDMYERRTGPMDLPKFGREKFKFSLLEIPSQVSPFSGIMSEVSSTERIVLNIDLDFLTFQPYFSSPPPPAVYRRQIPWIWPEDLCKKISEKNIPVECAAVSNSIRGGYTPIGYKFLGEVLSVILKSGETPADYVLLKKALLLRNQNQDDEAMEILQSFETEGSIETARAYHSAVMHYEKGFTREAKHLFEQCAQQDTDFLSPHNSFGPIYEAWKSSVSAFEEFKMMRVLLPENEDAKLGTIRSRENLGETNWAEIQYQEHLLIHSESDSPLAYFPLARIFMKKGNHLAAIPLIIKSISLSPQEPWFRISLAECFYQTGEVEKAKLELREALRLGYHFPIAYKLLAKVYWRLGKKRKALELGFEFLRLLLIAFKKSIRSYL